jgi:hypothetical protein
MFVSQLVNLPWHPCKSAPQQASDLKFPLHVRWHIGMMECHLCFTPMLAREGRCISLLRSLFLGMGSGGFLWWVCLPDQRRVSHIHFHIFFDSNASWSSPPPLGLYIYNLISSLLLVVVAINLHKSSKCKVPSSFKDFVDTATTASIARAAAFMAFFVLALFVLCLMVIMLLAEEYKSLFSCTEEDKGNCPLSKPVLDPHCGCLSDDPIRRGTHFCGGAISSICSLLQVLLGAGTLWALGQEIIQDII